MIIEKILRQLTPERIRAENEAVLRTKLPAEIQKWVEKYEKVGERETYIWKWLYRMFQVVQLPIVSRKYQKSLLEIKVLVTMFVIQLDDIADKKQKRALLNELLKIPFEQKYIKFSGLNQNEKNYLKFTIVVWNSIKKIIRKYPKYNQLEEIFNYDLAQILNEMKYSYLVNKNPYLINTTECWLYMPYNMVSFVYSGLDLMCSPEFDFQKIGKIRDVILEAQKMARIGNWISTWEREMKEKDLTSGVFAYAIDLEIITIDELRKKDKIEVVIKKIKSARIEKKLLIEWGRSYHRIKKLGKKMNFVKKFLSSLEKLIIFHLSSRGYK